MPDDEEEWLVVIDKFNTRWNFPSTIGAIDGKHIVLKAPPNSAQSIIITRGSSASSFWLWWTWTTSSARWMLGPMS